MHSPRPALLLDENLSYRLVARLADLYPGSAHVREHGLEQADDSAVWAFARGRDYVIVSKDNDFQQRAFVHGSPPKVIWLRLGNVSTRLILDVLRGHHAEISAFAARSSAALLVIG